MLTYAFESLHCVRVQIKTAEHNSRSRRAVLRIGATFEGVLRNFSIIATGPRNTAFFSITDMEWPQVKTKLQLLVSDKKQSREH